MKKYIVVGIFLLALSGAVHGQDAPSTPMDAAAPPDGPLLLRAPKISQWEIKYTYTKPEHEETQGPPPKAPSYQMSTIVTNGGLGVIQRKTVTKTGHFIHEVNVDINNKTLERWTDGSIEAVLMPGATKPFLSATSQAVSYVVRYDRSDFQDLDWVSKSNFAGAKKLNNVDCFLFKNGETTLYVDATSRLPVHWENKQESRDYIFSTPSMTTQTFPKSVTDELANESRVAAKLGGYGDRP